MSKMISVRIDDSVNDEILEACEDKSWDLSTFVRKSISFFLKYLEIREVIELELEAASS